MDEKFQKDVVKTFELDKKSFEFKEVDGALIAEFSGYASTFGNVDSYGDVIALGAFSETLINRPNVKLLYQHDIYRPIGNITELREDTKGLFFRAATIPTTDGKDAAMMLKSGVLDKFSIGFRVRDAEYEDGKRVIKELDLYEISVVTFPANDEAQLVAVKNMAEKINTVRDFERFLRDAGFSRNEAKAIAAKGFVGTEEREAKEDQLVNLINECVNYLKGK